MGVRRGDPGCRNLARAAWRERYRGEPATANIFVIDAQPEAWTGAGAKSRSGDNPQPEAARPAQRRTRATARIRLGHGLARR
jgi:hypothetical protein